MINIKSLDPNTIKIVEKLSKNILIYYIGYVTQSSVKSLYLIINKINGYMEEHNRNKYFTLVYTDKSKDALKSMKNYERQLNII